MAAKTKSSIKAIAFSLIHLDINTRTLCSNKKSLNLHQKALLTVPHTTTLTDNLKNKGSKKHLTAAW
ncbi:hypothetical protein SynROS8604_02454 [Synechococcus sp. ROS8604]|nr:hypothetical protein SynROS8604_02454 [Synechococcus sp. ROS8604]